MPSSYEAERAYTRRAETAGDPISAAVHAAAAARAAPSHPLRLSSTAELARLAEAALAQTVIDAHRAGYSWREIGALSGLPWQSLHRRYGRGRGKR